MCKITYQLNNILAKWLISRGYWVWVKDELFETILNFTYLMVELQIIKVLFL